MDDDDEMPRDDGSRSPPLAPREVSNARPRSFSCVVLDARKGSDVAVGDDSEEEEGYYDEEDDCDREALAALERLCIDKTRELFDDDEFKRILEKKIEERSHGETEVLLESMKHMMAFNNTSQSVKEELCSVMRFVCISKCDWLIVDDGAELEDWYVIINGSVKVIQADGSIEILSVGQSFGVCTNKEVTRQEGQVRTNDTNCQFVCVLRDDFHAIFDKFEQNKINVEDNGKLVLVLERKVTEDNKDGYIVIQGSKEKLMTQLLDSNMADPTYIEDFLLTYRVFIDSAHEVTDALVRLFTDKSSREKVARVMLLWVNNHFEDFDGDHRMLDFIDSFKGLLKHHKMFGHLKMLDIAHSTHSCMRLLSLSRPDKTKDLPFSLIGGPERGIKGIFISRVDKTSKLHASGLRKGDQILELNNRSCAGLSMKEVIKIINSSTHLSIKVKSNFYGFEEACLRRDCQKSKTFDSSRSSSSSSSSLGKKFRVTDEEDEGDATSFVSSGSDESKGTPKRSLSKFCKALLHIGGKQGSNESPGEAVLRFRRKHSLALPGLLLSRMSSSSDPDLSDVGSSNSLQNLSSLAAAVQSGASEGGQLKPPDAVLRVFRGDHTYKYVPVHKETTCKEVIATTMKEFGLSEPHSLCEVTFAGASLTRTRTLADHVTDLFARIPVNARYYLKSHSSPTLNFPEEVITSVLRESSFSFLELPAVELATQLTLRAFGLLRAIRSSDHICDLFDRHRDSKSRENVERFSQLSNEEFFWVVTEVCTESNPIKRAKVIKHFVRIAELCRLAQNYNSMFAIVGGLGHGSVTRLKGTWDKLPPKCLRTFEELQEAMDPSRNMAKYRNLLSSKAPDIPVVPFFPIFKKDVTFIHLGNDTKVNDLVNFEKMRMLAKEVRNLNRLTKGSYMSNTDVFKPFRDLASYSTEGRRKKGLMLLPRKLHEEGFLSKKAQTFLESLKVIYDEEELGCMSNLHEPSSRFLTLKKMLTQSCSTSDILSADDGACDANKAGGPGQMQGKRGASQPSIKISISKRSKLKPVVKKGSSLSSGSCSSSSSKKLNSGDKSLSIGMDQRWSSGSDDHSARSIDVVQRPTDLLDIPPPIVLTIPVQPTGHQAIRPVSHPPSKSQLAKKFPNFKPFLNSHQPYLSDGHNSSSSSSSSSLQPHPRPVLEPIYSPVSGGEEEAKERGSIPSHVPLKSTFGKGKRSHSSDRILERGDFS